MRMRRFAILWAIVVVVLLFLAIPAAHAQMLPAPLATSLHPAIAGPEPLPLSRPVLLLMQAPSVGHTVALTWQAGTGTAGAPATTGYFVYRASGACASGLNFSVLNTAAVTVTNYTDSTTALLPNTTWCYQVTATDAAGVQSVASNQAVAVIPGPPATPTGLTVTGVT